MQGAVKNLRALGLSLHCAALQNMYRLVVRSRYRDVVSCRVGRAWVHTPRALTEEQQASQQDTEGALTQQDTEGARTQQGLCQTARALTEEQQMQHTERQQASEPSSKEESSQGLLHLLKEIRGGQKTLEQVVESRLQKVEDRFQAVESRLQKVEGRFHKAFASLETKFGSILEAQVRGEVSREYGHSFSQQVTVRSLVGVLELLPAKARVVPDSPSVVQPMKEAPRGIVQMMLSSIVHTMQEALIKIQGSKPPKGPPVDPHFQLLHAAKFLGSFLLKEFVPQRLLKRLEEYARDKGYRGETLVQCYGESWANAHINTNEIGKLIGWMKTEKKVQQDANWGKAYNALLQLKSHFESGSLESFIYCGGGGLLCLLAHSNGMEISALSQELEIDCRGRAFVFLADRIAHVIVEIGEVKTTPDYSSSVPQLGRRLRALRMAADTMLIHNKRKVSIVLIGHIFLSKALVGADVKAVNDQVRIAEKAGFSLVIHSF